MRFSTGKKKSGLSASSRFKTLSRKTPKLYRPLGSFPFPDVRGKVVADVYLTMKSGLNCVTLCFDDNTELVVDIEPRLSFTAGYSDWKTGNQRVIKRWPLIRRK
jgi:hypothetical protein